jgi:hypothetical protein
MFIRTPIKKTKAEKAAKRARFEHNDDDDQ